MTINTGVKGTLAKLLATEDLVVEHRKCETAQFDVERRVLTLPVWDNASEDVYDICLLYTSPSPRDRQKSRMPSSA